MGGGILGWEAAWVRAGEGASGDENIAENNMDSRYCTQLLFSEYHSNMRRGSGVD